MSPCLFTSLTQRPQNGGKSSSESLWKTGYFDPRRVDHFCRHVSGWWNRSFGRSMVIRQGLIGVLSTQLWHHLYVDASLCELPSAAPTPASKAT